MTEISANSRLGSPVSRARRDEFRRVWRSYLLKAEATWELAVTDHLRQDRRAFLPFYDQCHIGRLTNVLSST
jgi:hypothetical protein